VLHAIGAGVLLAELQEPEDLSILLEWRGFDLDGENDGHLGLGFDVALTAVETRARSAAEVDALVRRGTANGSMLPEAAAPFFRLDRVEHAADFPAGFAILIAVDGPVRLSFGTNDSENLDAGSTTLVPFDAGAFSISGTVLVARPPQP
jgi:mannose-6-phosphate isomerase